MEASHNFDTEEMAKFGFDSSSEDDRQLWVITTPLVNAESVSYEQDSFEFGCKPVETKGL